MTCNLTFGLFNIDSLVLLAPVIAVFMVGSTHLRVNIGLFALQTCVIAVETVLFGLHRSEMHLCLIALALFALKSVAVPGFLLYLGHRLNIKRDTGTAIAAPVAMHLAIVFLGVSFFLARQLPVPPGDGLGWPGATAAISLVCTGLVLMMTRRIALSQIIGFLVMENGIYLFGLTQTDGMPMIVEMGIMLDVLVAVMIGGLLAFRIQKSFEHIDVTRLSELKE